MNKTQVAPGLRVGLYIHTCTSGKKQKNSISMPISSNFGKVYVGIKFADLNPNQLKPFKFRTGAVEQHTELIICLLVKVNFLLVTCTEDVNYMMVHNQ